jgi:shikimate kinase
MNLYLIGYRGSGKSSVAPLLATRLNRAVIDTDLLIEESARISISDIFSQFGAADFRARENAIIHDYPAEKKLIVSLGGGAPLSPANRNWIRENGKCVWLAAEPDVLWQRIYADDKSADQRPDLTEYGGLEEIQQLLGERTPIYAGCADFTIDVGQLPPEQIAEQIANWWNSDDKGS